jgi:S1-C subfamily serine protease
MAKKPRRFIFVLAIFSSLILLPGLSLAATEDAIVKIFTTAKKYNYDSPWHVAGFEQWSGSGCIIAGRRILTNAHVVSNAAYIEVLRNGDSKKYVAEVVAVAHEGDLALLKVEDDKFFAGTKPLELDGLPALLDSVVVYGFPEGGEGLSVTKGIISRIELTTYVHSWMQLLGLQIDAAINSGNSGGPVIKDGKVVGIAMQVKPDAENMGYIVPTPIIEHFLADIQDGQYDGFPDDGILFQSLENNALRATTGLPEGESGVYVNYVVPGTSADGLIFAGDVILGIDKRPVANDGSVLLRPGLRVSSDYYTTSHQVGDNTELSVWRQGSRRNIVIPLKTKRIDYPLVKLPEYDVDPEYYILAGLVLVPLSINHLSTWGENALKDAPTNLLKFLWTARERADEQVVIVSGIMNSEMTAGYGDDVTNVRIISVNGQAFASFREFTRLLDDALTKEAPIVLKTEDHTVIAISPQEHRDNIKQLLERYGIEAPHRVSLGENKSPTTH